MVSVGIDVSKEKSIVCILKPYGEVVVSPYESGNFVGTKRKIYKRGSSLLRKTGYEVMKCVKFGKPTEDNAVYLYMLKKEAEGKPKNIAKIAALNKFLRINYARAMEVYGDKDRLRV